MQRCEQMDREEFEAEVEAFVRMCRDYLEEVESFLKITEYDDFEQYKQYEATIIGEDGLGNKYEIPIIEGNGTLFMEFCGDYHEADVESLLRFLWYTMIGRLERATGKDSQISLFDFS